MSNQRYYGLLLLIILVGVLMRVFHFHLAYGADDQRWIIAAQEFARDHRTGLVPVYYGRALFRSVLALWGAGLGLSLATSAPLMFAFSCLATLLVAQGARTAFGPAAGLAAAAIYATHPLLMIFDVVTVPDALALLLLAAYLWLFLKYLQNNRTACLASSAFLVGLSFSAKEYYVLAALPLGACLLAEEGRRARRWRRLGLFSACVLAGLVVDVFLQVWDSGDPFAHFSALAGYGPRIVAAGIDQPLHTGWERVARLALSRLGYFPWLFADLGWISGFLLLWGLGFLALNSRACPSCRALVGVTLVFLAFLLVGPASLDPFRFVERQSYYLTILLPSLAMGAGGAFSAALASLQAGALRWSLLAAVAIGLASNVMVPNDFTEPTVSRVYVSEMVGVEQILKDAGKHGIEELMLPKFRFQTCLPEWYRSYGVKLTLRDADDERSARALADYLKSDPHRALFVQRRDIRRSLMLDLRRGEYDPRNDPYPSSRLVMDVLEAEGCSVRQVRVPDTALKSWLAAFGLVKFEQDQVGWVYQFEQGANEK